MSDPVVQRANESDVDQAVRIARELDPETWAKVDHIAAMIDPVSFAEYEIIRDGIRFSPDHPRRDYFQSKARATAWEILRYLGVVPESFDWLPVLQRMREEVLNADF